MTAIWGKTAGIPGQGGAPSRGPGFPGCIWGGGAHHDGNAGEEHSRDKLPDPVEVSRGKLHSQVPCCRPQTPEDPPLSSRDAQGQLFWGEGMRWDGIEGKTTGARLIRWGLTQPLPITLPPPDTHINAHLSPRGSRTANLISLPKTWLICGHRRVRGNQGEAVLGRAGLLIPAKPPGMPRDPPGYLCLAKRSSRLGR